jgi:hypothetical protein
MRAIDNPPKISGPEIFLNLVGTKTSPRSCTVLGIANGIMHIRLDQWVEPATQVLAIFSRITLSGEVVYCASKESWYRTSIAINGGIDRRHGPRLSVLQPTMVTALSNNGSASSEGMLLDFSVCGIRVNMPHGVETGTMIFVETESAVVVGEVRHSHEKRGGCFEGGIEITDVLSSPEGRRKSRSFLKNVRRKFGQMIEFRGV